MIKTPMSGSVTSGEVIGSTSVICRVYKMLSLLPFCLLPITLEDPRPVAHILSRDQVDLKGVKTLEI